MLSGLDPSKMLPINGSSLPRWVLPGFDLKELWPAGANKNSTPAHFLGGAIVSLADLDVLMKKHSFPALPATAGSVAMTLTPDVSTS